MIFKSIGRLENKTDRAFFQEQIQVYTRLVEVFCEKNGCELQAKESGSYTEELQAMGVIDHADEVEKLKGFLGERYPRFALAVNFVISNREKVGSLVDGLGQLQKTGVSEAGVGAERLYTGRFLLRSGRLEPRIFAGRISCAARQRH